MAQASSVKVRAPSRGEIERAAEIGMIAFQSSDRDSWLRSHEWIADNRGLDYLVLVEADGELVASLICTPGAARFGDDIVPFAAVGGVATLPEHRNCGYAGLMMQRAVQLLCAAGCRTSALWPFSYQYYRKFGWEVGSEHRRYTLPSELAAQLAQPHGTRPARENDLSAVSRLIDRFARRYNCVTVRDDPWWSCIRAVHGFTLGGECDPRKTVCPWVHETGGEIDGCAMLSVAGEGDKANVDVREIVADTPEARREILSRLAAIGAATISLHLPADDGLLQELPNPKLVSTEIHPGFQFRVIDPPAALELRTVDPTLSGRIGLLVADPVLPAFDFSVEVSKGRISRAKAQCKERLSMNVQTFAQLYSGYVSPARAAELGRIEATSGRALDFANRLFPRTVPFRSMIELG